MVCLLAFVKEEKNSLIYEDGLPGMVVLGPKLVFQLEMFKNKNSNTI